MDYLIVFGVALATVLVVTPMTKALSARVGAVDEPEERRIHRVATPRLGGLAILAAMLVSLAVASRLPEFQDVFTTTSEPIAIVLAMVVIAVVGVVDDVRGLSAPVKLAGQVVAAGMLVLFGVVLLFVYLPGSLISLDRDLAAIFTILAIVAMINAVNLVDGLDGLAAGIVAIAAGALFLYTQLSQPLVPPAETVSSGPLVLAALVGACLGFLVFNFHPAQVFMGDTGAMLLGLLLGAAGVSAIGNIVSPTRADFTALSLPVLVPALVLAVPFVDTIWAVVRRLGGGRAVFSPDKKHLHHRLVEMGHSHRRAVVIMYCWSALLAFLAVGSGLMPVGQVAAVAGVGLLLALAALLLPRLLHRHRPSGEALTHPATRRRPFVPSFTRAQTKNPETASDQQERGQGEL